MYISDTGIELLLIAALMSLLGMAINSFISNQSDRARRALQQSRIQSFIDTANEIEEATQRLMQEIPAEAMTEILQQASIADLFALQTAITTTKDATQRLETIYLKQIRACAQGIAPRS